MLGAFLLITPIAPAQAQTGLPPNIASAGVTQAQWQAAQGTIARLARATNASEAALRNLAIELFDAQPGLAFDQYLQSIEDGAHRLQEALASARALTPASDPARDALRQRAIAAAEQGHLLEAQALFDQYNAEALRALQALVAGPMIDLARSYQAAAEIAEARGDYEGAAARWAQAAAVTPDTELAMKLEALRSQAHNLMRAGTTHFRPELVLQARGVYETTILALAPRDAEPQQWAENQNDYAQILAASGFGDEGVEDRAREILRVAVESGLGGNATRASLYANYGQALTTLAERERSAAEAQLAVQMFRRALEVGSNDRVTTQHNLAEALATQGRFGGDRQALVEAEALFREVIAATPRDTQTHDWAVSNNALGFFLSGLAFNDAPDRLPEAIAQFRGTLAVVSRNSYPLTWAQAQNGLAVALMEEGRRGRADAFREAVEAQRAILEIVTPSNATFARWAVLRNNLCWALIGLGRNGDAAALREAVQVQRETLAAWPPDLIDLDRTIHHYALAYALGRLGDMNEDASMLRESIAPFREAIRVDIAQNPDAWAERRIDYVSWTLLGLTTQGDASAAAEAEQLLREVESAQSHLARRQQYLEAHSLHADLLHARAIQARDPALLPQAIAQRRRSLSMLQQAQDPSVRQLSIERTRLAAALRDSYGAGDRAALAEARTVAAQALREAQHAGDQDGVAAINRLIASFDRMR